MTQSFDEWMSKNHSGAFDTPHQRDCYEAGAASRQAEIDELHKRIDNALAQLELLHFMKTTNSNNAIKILKGESNE